MVVKETQVMTKGAMFPMQRSVFTAFFCGSALVLLDCGRPKWPGLLFLMRRHQPASLVIGELSLFGCRVRRPWGGMLLVTKHKEHNTKEWLIGSLRGVRSKPKKKPRDRAIASREVNIAQLSISAIVHGRRRH